MNFIREDLRMKNYNDVAIAERFIVPRGTEFWSIGLQENIISTNDLVIKITNKTYFGDWIFGNIQVVFQNQALTYATGEDMRGYADKVNGEIGLTYSKLIEYK